MSDRMTAAEYQQYLKTGKFKGQARSKYNNVKTQTDGITFDSKKEAARYEELKLMQKAGVILCFYMQQRFNIAKNIDYIADFVILYVDGRFEIEDVKGVKTDVYKIKKKLFKEKYGLEIKEV